MFNKTTRLLTKSTKHTKSLDTMVNNLMETNGEIAEKVMDNLNKINDLQVEVRHLELQQKANRNIISNLNSIIKGGR